MKNRIKNIANNLLRESFEALRNLHESIEPSKCFVCMYVVYVVCHGVFYNVNKHVDKYAHEYFEQSNSIELNEFFSFYSISYGSLCCFFLFFIITSMTLSSSITNTHNGPSIQWFCSDVCVVLPHKHTNMHGVFSWCVWCATMHMSGSVEWIRIITSEHITSGVTDTHSDTSIIQPYSKQQQIMHMPSVLRLAAASLK